MGWMKLSQWTPLLKNQSNDQKKGKCKFGRKEQITDDKYDAYATCFSELVEREAIDLQVPLEALLVHPRWQTTVLVLCNTERRNLSGEAQTSQSNIQHTTRLY